MPSQLNSYIACFFLLVFFGKLLSVDSALPQVFFGGETITFINPFCEKRNAKPFDEPHVEPSSQTNIAIGEMCTSLFQFEFPQWEASALALNFQPPQHKAASSTPVFQDELSPPPKV